MNMAMMTTLTMMLVLGAQDVKKDIVYRTVDGAELKADFYMPGKPLAEPVPFVVVIHGGGWTSGKKEDMAALCQGLAQAGFASATIQYRLAPKSKWPAMIEDSQIAVRYFRENAEKYGIDAGRFGVTGASAGGHLALLTGFNDGWNSSVTEQKGSNKVSAIFNIFGPTDLTQDFAEPVANFVCMQVMGKQYSKTDKDIVALGPLSHVKKGVPPVFTLQGDKDPLVPPKQANRLDEALKAVGVEHTLNMIPGMGHEVDMSNPECAKAMAGGIEFFKKHLGPGSKEVR